MPNQCTHCGKIIPDASEELLKGCECGSKFFYYIKQERLDQINREREDDTIRELESSDKVQIEKDIREMTGLDEEPEKPVILDIESIKVIRPGKFEIDIVKLLSKNRPLVYKLEEGKYIIDLSSSIKPYEDEIKNKIVDPKSVGYRRKKIVEHKEDEEVEEEIDLTEEMKENTKRENSQEDDTQNS